MSFFITDLECQNHEYFGQVASPHHPDNYIVEAGWCIDNGSIESEYFHNKEESLKSKWFDNLKHCKFLVAHNATFEIQWFMKTYPEVFLDWIAKGGRIYCTQLAEYLLSNQEMTYPSLEDCAIKRKGNYADDEVRKLDEVKILWSQGVLTADIEESLLHDYLTNEVYGDIANTRRILYSQLAELNKRGMMNNAMIRMTALLFNAIATFNGLYVNRQVAFTNLETQLADIDQTKQSILKMLPADVPEELEFSFTSDYHLSAFLFGGGVNYRKRLPYDPPKYEKVDAHEFADGTFIPVTEADAKGEYYIEKHGDVVRYKSGKNKGYPKVFSIDSDVQKLKWYDLVYQFKGLLDLEALPKHVSEQYLGKRAEFRGKRDLPDGTPVYSTGKDSLDLLANFTDVAKPLKNLAALLKDTGTYYLYENPNTGKQSGMLQFVEPNGIIHHNLNATSTITGRLSSNRPNLQNLPRGNTSNVKKMFTSRFGDSWVYEYDETCIKGIYPVADYPEAPFEGMIKVTGQIVEVDYSALEVVGLAAISGDKNLLKQLLSGTDMHCLRLAAKLGEPYEDVLEKCKNQDHPQYKEYDAMRTAIKPRAFSDQYGASAEGISFSTGCTLEEAIEFKRIEAELFPESKAFAGAVVRPMVEATGLASPMLREMWGERPVLTRKGFYQAKSGTCYSFKQYPKWDKESRQEIMDYKDTQIANYWCQGESSFIVQAATGRVIYEFVRRKFFDGYALPINTVHDAIYLDCATPYHAREAGLLVQKLMEETPKWLCSAIPALKEWNYDTTPFPAAAEAGENMADKLHIH